jgi:predicted NBD/HSP70 family sugar kinase
VDCHDFAGDRLSNHSLTAPDPYAGAAGLAAAVEHDLECELTQTHGIPVVMDNDANLAALGDSTQASVSERATSST